MTAVSSSKYVNCRQCESGESAELELISDWVQTNNTCQGTGLVEQCEEAGGTCVTVQEGFYTVSAVWLSVGTIWFIWIFRALRQLQTIHPLEWRVLNKPEKRQEEEEEGTGEKFKYFCCC